MENLILERENKMFKIKKYTRILFILNLIVFGIGVLSFFNSNEVILFLSQLFIMSMLLIISILEYGFRKLEVKLYNELKNFYKDDLDGYCIEKINILEKNKLLIDRLGLILISLCSISFIISLVLQLSENINVFHIVKNTSLVSFVILFLQESRYSKKLTSTIDLLIDSFYSFKNII